ncbi:hypothetical protein [Alterinioella nitratireducens]|uniref:hypothetical protein n=1 Tax=Alterinioella nitratireducens TaxID=2735915 RepID=UPI001557357B|nr:hypothetical protein [Alterinioella nitratireducens]NPD18461.1 hypothetical protein [Alterinioella nitratireducens]
MVRQRVDPASKRRNPERYRGNAAWTQRSIVMNRIIYIVGLIVIVLAILSFIGLA